MLQNYSSTDIRNDKKIQNNFLTANFKKLNLLCNIYKGDFYLDSFNYFLINSEFITFNKLFSRDVSQNNDHFFTDEFFNNFKKYINNLNEFKNIFILGSNAGNNYYSNLLQFLPRIIFINKKNIKIAIHRNSSTKFRNLIKLVMDAKKIKFSFVYLDDDFYKFIDCQMPQFLDLNTSIKILKSLLVPKISNSSDKKIYVTREDSSYRKIINEADIVPILISKGYKVINPQLYSIDEQIKIFSQADKIIAPHGSNLSNIIFCKPETKVYEVGPIFKNDYEKIFENRYKILAKKCNLNYFRFVTDTVSVSKHSDVALKYIDKNILLNSNYYKNLIVKIKDIKEIN